MFLAPTVANPVLVMSMPNVKYALMPVLAQLVTMAGSKIPLM